jgi:hypothetical protein
MEEGLEARSSVSNVLALFLKLASGPTRPLQEQLRILWVAKTLFSATLRALPANLLLTGVSFICTDGTLDLRMIVALLFPWAKKSVGLLALTWDLALGSVPCLVAGLVLFRCAVCLHRQDEVVSFIGDLVRHLCIALRDSFSEGTCSMLLPKWPADAITQFTFGKGSLTRLPLRLAARKVFREVPPTTHASTFVFVSSPVVRQGSTSQSLSRTRPNCWPAQFQEFIQFPNVNSQVIVEGAGPLFQETHQRGRTISNSPSNPKN